MKPHKALANRFILRLSCWSRSLRTSTEARLRGILAGILLTTMAAHAISSTNIWVGAGATSAWNDPGNWNAQGVPTFNGFANLTNSGATGLPGTNGMGAVGTPNITVTNDTVVGQLWFCNTNWANLWPSYHTIGINPGVTLTISNSGANLGAGSQNILQVMSHSGYGTLFGGSGNVNDLTDRSPNFTIYATIQGGAGSTLAVIATNNVTAWNQGNITVQNGTLNGGTFAEPCNATLDLSGLDTFYAAINHLSVGADGAPGLWYIQRARGTMWLARTNYLELLGTGAFPNEGGTTAGIWAGLNAQNNGAGTNHQGSIFLGITNGVYCNTGIGLGLRGNSGFIGFNTNNPAGISGAYFRNRSGTGRQSLWSLGDRTGTASEGQDVRGEMDFSWGSVDAMVDTLRVAVSAINNNRAIGGLYLGKGLIDVNTLVLGCQDGTVGGAAQGTICVTNTAVLKVNTAARIGTLSGTVGSGQYYGRILISDGGSVQFGNTAPVTCGPFESSIYVDNGSSLSVFTVGSPTFHLTNLRLANSTLTADRGTASNPTTGGLIFVDNLDLSGNNTINMLGPVLVLGQFPIIKYSTIVNGGFDNLTLGSTSLGVTGYLSNNVANSSIDFVVTASDTAVLTWDGQTNGVPVSNWDFGLTPDWKGGKSYTQTGVPGSLVLFDDTAAGSTTVTFTNASMAPAALVISNESKSYTFNGSGSLIGPTALIKSGAGSLTLANTGVNTFSGGVFLNGGTLSVGGNGNVLPANGTVTLQDVAGVGINMNSLPLTVGALTGGGANGGNIAMGSSNLLITADAGNYAGVISGSGKLIKYGSGTQILSGNSTYSGGTFVTNSTLRVLNTGIGTGPLFISTNGVVQLGDGTTDGQVFSQYITNFGGTLHLKPAADTALTNILVGTGSLAKTIGSGTTVTITNANLYSGATLVQEGILAISHSQALGSGAVTVGNAIPLTKLALSGNITLANAINLSGKTGAVVPSPAGLENVAGTNFVTGAVTVQGSTCFSVASEDGKLTLSGPFNNSQNGVLCQLWLRGASEGLWTSVLKDNAANKLEIDKVDAGTWTLAGTNTYTGATYINGGKLVVQGALAGTSSVLVYDTSCTLSGTGYIAGAVTNSGTIDLAADGVPGSLTISNHLLLDSFGTVVMDVSAAGNDRIRGLRTVVMDGALRVILTGTLSGNAMFKLFDATNYVGGFSSVELPDITPLTWDTSFLAVDGTLRAVGGPATPAPHVTIAPAGSAGILLSGTGTLVAPYHVLTTTNVVLPLAEWSVLGEGTFGNGTFQFADPAATNGTPRFYLISTPSF